MNKFWFFLAIVWWVSAVIGFLSKFPVIELETLKSVLLGFLCMLLSRDD